MTKPRSSRKQRGFTLVELMAVVLITAILALVGISVFRRYVTSSKSAEATSVMQAVRAAEEAYMAENHVYLNVSTASGGLAWYPSTAPSQKVYEWHAASHADYARWQALAPAVNRSVQFGYLVNAGVSGSAIPAMQTTKKLTFATPNRDWYLIQAKGDTDGDGRSAIYVATSLTGDIYAEDVD